MIIEFYIAEGKHPYRWRAKARNGKIIATSGEGYSNRTNAVKGYTSFAKNHKSNNFRIICNW